MTTAQTMIESSFKGYRPLVGPMDLQLEELRTFLGCDGWPTGPLSADNTQGMRLIRLGGINVDYANYQRTGALKTKSSINEGIIPPIWGFPRLGQRPDGTLWATDGGSTVVGLREAGATAGVWVPCLVFYSDGSRFEAGVFGDANSRRVANDAFNKFTADLHSQRDWAVDVQALLKKYGYVMSSKNKVEVLGSGEVCRFVNASSSLREMYHDAKTDGKNVCDSIIELARNLCDGEPRLLSSVKNCRGLRALHRFLKGDTAPTRVDLFSRLRSAPYQQLNEAYELRRLADPREQAVDSFVAVVMDLHKK